MKLHDVFLFILQVQFIRSVNCDALLCNACGSLK